jgi:hypothetical protein
VHPFPIEEETMPAEQQGSVYRTKTAGYGIRWTDERGQRRRQAGFISPSKARKWFRDVELPRMRGGLIDEPLTLREFSERYLSRYAVDRQRVTVQNSVTVSFGRCASSGT